MEMFVSLVRSYLHEPHASLVNGILLGRQLFVTDTFYTQLKHVGLIHIVVLSGQNIAILANASLSLLVPLVGRRNASILAIFIIVGFVLFVGVEPPVVRASIMGTIALVGLLFGRKTIALFTLIISGIVMILAQPEWISSISFQLSFGATLGIIMFGSTPQEKSLSSQDQTQENNNLHKVMTYFYEELRISISAQLFTLPLIFWYFRQISLVAPLANILISWTIVPIMVISAVTIGLGFVHWELGFYSSWLLYPLLSWLIIVVEALDKVPYSSFTW